MTRLRLKRYSDRDFRRTRIFSQRLGAWLMREGLVLLAVVAWIFFISVAVWQARGAS